MNKYCKTVFNHLTRGGVAQWVARQTRDGWIPVSREVRAPSKAAVVSLGKNFYSHCLEQVIACFTIELK